MKIFINLICVFVLVSFFSSCGVITKTRYGNGLKLNVELNVFKKDDSKQGKHAKQRRDAEKPHAKPVVPETAAATGQDGQETIANEDLTITPVPMEPGSGKKSLKGKAGKIQRQIRQVAQEFAPSKVGKKDQEGPMEPNARMAGILFYGALIWKIAAAGAGILLSSAISTMLSIFLLAGFILALISLHKIRMSGGAYAGRGLALSIVIISALYIFFIILVLLIFAAFLATLI